MVVMRCDAEISTAGGVKCAIHQVDISNKEQIEQSIAEAAQQHERLHSVVVSAGSDIKQPFLAEVTDEHGMR